MFGVQGLGFRVQGLRFRVQQLRIEQFYSRVTLRQNTHPPKESHNFGIYKVSFFTTNEFHLQLDCLHLYMTSRSRLHYFMSHLELEE